MFKFIAWPTAVGFIIGIVAIIRLQSGVAPGGESLEPAGMALILAMGLACGVVIGAVTAYVHGKKRK